MGKGERMAKVGVGDHEESLGKGLVREFRIRLVRTSACFGSTLDPSSSGAKRAGTWVPFVVPMIP